MFLAAVRRPEVVCANRVQPREPFFQQLWGPSMMMNRRQFAWAAAAGPAVFARVLDVLAAPARYDLIVKGGRVLDPSLRLDAIRDVAIADGRIAAVGADIAEDAAETIDARGKVVVPGLIDVHENDVATSFNLTVMSHMGQTVSPLPRLMDLLKPGDIVTHMFAPPPNSIVDETGRILPEVLAARRRGVWFDLGNGRTGHLRWDIVERVMQAGFWPDTFSTDWTPEGRTAQVIDFPNVMSKFLDFGMSLDQVVARATVNASRVFEVFRDRGTLNVGAPADVAVLELRQGLFEFVDNYGNRRTGRQRLFPSGTILGGKRVPARA